MTLLADVIRYTIILRSDGEYFVTDVSNFLTSILENTQGFIIKINNTMGKGQFYTGLNVTLLVNISPGSSSIYYVCEVQFHTAQTFSLKAGLSHDLFDKSKEMDKELLKMKGNAIVSVHFQMTPLPPPPFGEKKPQFSLTCTGNVVRVMKKRDSI